MKSVVNSIAWACCILAVGILSSISARAQYSQQVQDLRAATDLYDERGYAHSSVVSVDGKLVINHANGGVSYSYPIVSTTISGYPFNVSLNYASVPFTAFRDYEVQTVYERWNQFHQNRPAWILSCNNFAVGLLSSNGMFHCDSAIFSTNPPRTTFADSDMVWVADGWDFTNRMEYLPAADESQGYIDHIRILRGDGSVLELVNKKTFNPLQDAALRADLYTGYYFENAANSSGFGIVTYDDLANWPPPAKRIIQSASPGDTAARPFRPRILRYFSGGLCYRFKEWPHPYGANSYAGRGMYRPDRFGGVKAGPTIFYLESIESNAGPIVPKFTRSRHTYPRVVPAGSGDIGDPIIGAIEDSTVGRALITEFGDVKVNYGSLGMVIEAYGRTTTVKYRKILASGNATSTTSIPIPARGMLTPTSAWLAKLKENDANSDPLYESYLAYVTEIADPEGRITTFNYEPYTRIYQNYNFPLLNPPGGQTLTLTCKNYRLNEVIEPTAKYKISYAHGNWFRGGTAFREDTVRSATMVGVIGAANVDHNYPFYQNNVAAYIRKYDLKNTLLTTQECLYDYTVADGFIWGQHRFVDHLAGTARITEQAYSHQNVTIPFAFLPTPRHTMLVGTLERGADTTATTINYVQATTSKYLWLPSSQTTTVNGILKSKQTFSYAYDTARTYGGDAALAAKVGVEVKRKITNVVDPYSNAPVLRDTAEYIHLPLIDTNLTRIDTTYDRTASYENYRRLYQNDSIDLPWEYAMFDPRVAVYDIDTLTGRNFLPPVFGMLKRQVTAENGGIIVAGKEMVYTASNPSPAKLNELYSRGLLLRDSVIGMDGVKIPGTTYEYTRTAGRNLLGAMTNANGAQQRFFYHDYASPRLTVSGGFRAVGSIMQNNDAKRDSVLPNSAYFALGYEKPQVAETHIRKYRLANTLGNPAQDTLLDLKQYTFFGITKSVVDANRNLAQFEYDKNGRLLTMWSPFDFPPLSSSGSVTYSGTQRIPLYGSALSEHRIDTSICTDTTASRKYGPWTEARYKKFFAAWPLQEYPDCPCGTDLQAKAKNKSQGILVDCFESIPFIEYQTIIGELRYVKDSASPLRYVTNIDELYLELHPLEVTGECVVLTVSVTPGVNRTFLFNCDSIPPGFGGEVAGDGALKVDLIAAAQDLQNLPVGGVVDVTLHISTPGASIEFVNGDNGEDTRPSLVVKGSFTKPMETYDYTLAYAYDDDSLKATVTAKVDDILHTSNVYDLVGMQGATSRRVTGTHRFGADGRVLKSEHKIVTGNTFRIDSLVYAYTGGGARTRAKDQEGDTMVTKYDASGRPIEVTNTDGTRSTISYRAGSPASFGFANPQAQEFHGFVSAKAATNENGTKFVDYYDAFDRLRIQVADSGDSASGHLNLTTRYNYDEQNRLTEVINPKGDTTFYWYDALGRVRQKSQPDLGIISYAYDAVGNVRFVQNQEQADKTRLLFNQYDDMNRLVVVGEAVFNGVPGRPGYEDDGYQGQGGWLYGHFYTPDGMAFTTRKKESGATILSGPAQNRLTDGLDPTKLNVGNRSVPPPLTANPTLWELSLTAGPPFWQKSFTAFKFCPLPVDTMMGETSVPKTPYFKHPVGFYPSPSGPFAALNDFENLAKYPHHARIAVSYDTLPYIAGSIWGHFPSHGQWDSLMPTNKVRNTKGRETAIAYREHGGEPWHYQVLSYDERGRLEALVRWTENIGFDAVYYHYNSMNKITSVRVVDFARQYQTWYGYDVNGRNDTVWTKLHDVNAGLVPGSNPSQTWRFKNPLARPDYYDNITGADSADIVYRYTKIGKIDSMLYPRISVLVDYAYNHRKWLDSITSTQGSVALFKEVLKYDSTGQITSQRAEHSGFAYTPDQAYLYDRVQRLTKWIKDIDTSIYTYDEVGNRTASQRRIGGTLGYEEATAHSFGGVAGGSNRLEQSATQDAGGIFVWPGQLNHAYDGNGAMVMKSQMPHVNVGPGQNQEFVYSYRGLMRRLASGGWDTMKLEMRYRHSPMGEREQKRVYYLPQHDSIRNYSWVYYLLGARNEQLAVYHGQQTSKKFCNDSGRWVYMYPVEYLTQGLGGTANLMTLPTHQRKYMVTDHLGSVRVVLDSGGSVLSSSDYDPFGEPISIIGAVTGERKGFIDRERDLESSMLNDGVRQLDGPRFTSIDPLMDQYPSLSAYVYAANNPVRLVDNNGKEIDFSDKSNPKNARELFMEALTYLEEQGVKEAYILRALLNDKSFTIKLIIGGEGTSYWPAGKILFWHPDLAFSYKDAKGKTQNLSPAMQLLHEGAHALMHNIDDKLTDIFGEPVAESYLGDAESLHNAMASQPDEKFSDYAEWYVINFIEFPAAKKAGEVTRPRVDHQSGSFIWVPGVSDNGISKRKQGGKK